MGAAGAAVRDEIRAAGAQAEAHAVDVTDREAVKAAAARTGAVDVLVNNAGVVSGHRLLDATDEAIERTMHVNVMALYWVTRAFLGGMAVRVHGKRAARGLAVHLRALEGSLLLRRPAGGIRNAGLDRERRAFRQ